MVVNIRYGTLLGILINLGLFVFGHLSIGASVDLGKATVAGSTIHYNTIYTFSLGASLVDMWNACAIVLVVLIGSFSGCWPYLKLIFMLALWCVPPQNVSPKRRGVLIQVLDVMGKWSLIDV